MLFALPTPPPGLDALQRTVYDEAMAKVVAACERVPDRVQHLMTAEGLTFEAALAKAVVEARMAAERELAAYFISIQPPPAGVQ